MNKIEQVRDALESVKRSIAFDVQDWSTDKRLAWIYGIIMGWGDASDEVARKHRWTAEDVATMQRHRAALAILKDMDGQEPVAWMAVIRYPDGDDSLVYGSTREGAVQMGYERTRVTGTVVRVAPLYAHPSPSAPVDIAEIIAAGDAMSRALMLNERYNVDGGLDEGMNRIDIECSNAWTTATAKHRTA